MPSPQNLTGNSYNHLIEQGAQDVHHAFNIAQEGQYDVVFEDRRLLLADSEEYEQYQQAMEAAGLPYIHRAEEVSISEEGVAVVEIPRDARNLAQVSVSAADINGRTISPEDIFESFGAVLHALAVNTGKLPNERTIGLRSTLYSRVDNTVMLTPATRLEEASLARKNRILEAVYSQLNAVRALKSERLLNSFMDGIQ